MQRYVMTLRCPDQPGIIRAFAEGVVNASGNIVDNKQFSDPDSGTFCMRTEVDSPLGSAEEVEQHLLAALAGFSPSLTVRRESAHRKMLVMVSKFDHCLVDLLYRHETGELPVEIPLVVSNHEDLRGLVEHHGIPFVHLPVTKETKADAEAALLDLVEKHEIDFVVLARYMQVLSDDLCRALEGRVINIHHSFLPGFKGAKPYHQAYARGVKLIGATAHYVTADLDEGPIIEQEVTRVTHAASPEALVALGRDTERLALSRAVRQHAEDRVLLIGSRTVVFSA
ncbi:formyltetrahydrofolate deformylase [Nocardioides nematodiphilus]|uniref:formyltetrahydrofolate deformylase n=1 Tax=Nocardioides nematodiphilus TaxID=2849669 RepID=UPI001CD960C0|nr:formyltetrahydrofolate deformylase [Nocardioides nematodiphilus]MCA1981659.1 formyltetrahydrofolate deformylase [Nocardioides nematodiphilus]